MKPVLFCLFLVLVAGTASGEIVFGVHTVHFEDNDRFNNETELVAWKQGSNVFGTMVNSYGTRSFFYAWDWRPHKRIGAFLGAASGYCKNSDYNNGKEHCPFGLRPIVAPYIEYDMGATRISVVTFGSSITTTLSFEIF